MSARRNWLMCCIYFLCCLL